MSSLKMTFSLASLIIVFGLVFAPMSVMAHTADPHTPALTDPDNHVHPVVMIADPDVDMRTDGIQVVDKAADAETGLVGTIEFDVMVTLPSAGLDTGNATGQIANGEVTAIARTAAYAPVGDGTGGAIGVVATADTDDATMVTLAFTITSTFDDDADADTTDDQQRVADLDALIEAGIYVDLYVNAGAITVDQLVATADMQDQSNLQSDTLTVQVVKPPDTEAPTLMLTQSTDEDTDVTTVTLDFNDNVSIDADSINVTYAAMPAALDGTYEVSDPMAADDVATSFDYTITVTPSAATLETGDLPAGEVTLMISAMDASGNSLAAPGEIEVDIAARPYMDMESPMVEILPDPGRKSEAFDISFTVTDNFSPATDITTAVAITPTTASVTDFAPMAMMQPDGSYMVTITPVAATAEMPSIPESTIKVTVTATDAAGNPKEGDDTGRDSEFFFLAERTYVAPPDTTPPTVAITHSTDAMMVTTVTLAFSEALQGMPAVAHSVMPVGLADTYAVSAVMDDGDATTENTYTFTITPNALMIGDADLAAGTITIVVSAMDAAGNALTTGNTGTVALEARTAPKDVTAPTFTHNAPTDAISGATVVTLTFSESVTGVGVAGNPSMDDGKYTAIVAGSGTAHTVTITPIPRSDLAADEGQRVITFTVSGMDAAGNKVDGSFSLILSARKTMQEEPPDPDNKAPVFATDAEIAPITGTVGVPITAVTLPRATDADGDTITYSIVGTLPAGLSFNHVTQRLSGTPTAAMAATEYTYVANDGNGGITALGFTLTINAMAQPPASGDIPGTYAAGVTLITSGMVYANSFVTLGDVSLPDLEEFFELGGTIGVSNGDTVDDKNSRTVVISEILWGLDFGAPATDQTKWQFIELYNTTGAAIDLTGWTLTFTTGNVLPAIDIDQISNRGRNGWDVDSGDTGRSGRVTGTVATDDASAITPVNIVSMYRNIDYAKVKKIHDANNATENRKKQLDGFPSGNTKGSWKSSKRRSAYNRWIYDSKRIEHFKSEPILSPSGVAGTPFRINEFGNDTGSENDWVELHNITDATQSLKNYSLSAVTKKGTDARLFHFHDKDYKVGPKGYVVISTRHPRDTDLASGKDVSIADDQEENKGASHLFVVRSVNLPDDGKFALILRNHHEKQGSDAHLVDVVATRQGAFGDNNIATSLWPLKATGAPHENVIDGGDENFAAGKVYQRNSGNGRGEKQFAVRGFTGIGYDRAAENSSANGGTPGYDNGAIKDKIMDGTTVVFDGEITFSEIMLSLGDGRQNLPQWIELYNNSMTQAVNLNGWKLHVENTADVDTALDAVLTLGSMVIPPNQTVLIVTNTGRVSDADHFPSNRVLNLWTNKGHRDALEMVKRTDQVFSTTGLYLKLADTKKNTVDEFGNLDGNRRTRDELDATWVIPMNGVDDERRSSLIRVYDDGVPVPGTMEEAWVLAEETNLAFAISETYYGDPDDYGTPGFRAGGPLPVSLSKFRPERLKDTGEIVVRWATESELNNAGFNILRSETRDGEFTKVHFEAGQGTTSERTVYEWKDKSAKPNVVYYYQIQDVSLDGDVTTLRVTHLRGNVTVAGKATTTWGEIKALQ